MSADSDELKRSAFRAVRWTTAGAGARALIQVAQLATLARLLSPADYGLMAITSAFLALGVMFADLGINSAFVQRQTVTDDERSSLFWLNLLVSVVLMGLLMALSPLLAAVFNDARLAQVLMLSAVTFPLAALGQQVRMSAEKALDFRPLAVLEAAAAITGLALGVAAALAGAGVYALVVAALATAATSSGLAWLLVARGWRPARRLRLGDVKPYLAFGGAAITGNAINQVNMALDLLLGGRAMLAGQLGLYSVPRNLCLQLQFLVNPIVTRVGFPLIAQIQDDVPRVRSVYLKVLAMTAATNAPVYLGLAAFAPEVITLLLGPGWDGAAGILRILALWGLVRSTANPVGSLVFGMGRADLLLKWNATLLFVFIPCLWIGARQGPIGLAATLLGMQAALFVPAWYWLVRPLCGAGLREYTACVLRPCLIALVSVAIAWVGAGLVEGLVSRLTVGIATAMVLQLALSFVFNRQWAMAVLQLASPRK